MPRPTETAVADHLRTFSRELVAAAETVEPSSEIDIDLREIAENAERMASAFSGDTLAAVATAEQLFRLTDRAQAVRSGMDKPNAPSGTKTQLAIENLRNFIITRRVIQLADGTSEWAE